MSSLELERQVLKIVRENKIDFKDVFAYKTFEEFSKNTHSQITEKEWVLLNTWATL